MPRLFIALDLPDAIRDGLYGLGGSIPGSRAVPHCQLHVTLKFMGDIEASLVSLITETLSEVRQPAFTMMIKGVGHFPPRGKPTVLWAGVGNCEELPLLHKRIENILYHRGIARETRKFFPHVTLARLHNSPPSRIGPFLAGNSLLASPEFTATAFTLYASSLTPKGAIHTCIQTFHLQGKIEKPQPD